MAYFSHFKNEWYKFSDGSTQLINDITKFAAFRNVWINEPRAQLKYEIKDGELPHSISFKLYDTVDYWWMILLVNQIVDFDAAWPKSSADLDNHIAEKYPFNKPNDIHHYVHPNGTVTDLLGMRVFHNVGTDEAAIIEGELSGVRIYDHELALNEQKRNIILIDPDYVGLVASEFERLMKNG
jgi:hypothetical protein